MINSLGFIIWWRAFKTKKRVVPKTCTATRKNALFLCRNILEILWAWIILIMGSIIVYRRYMKHKDLSHYNRKQIIVTIMVVNICGSASNYLAYLLYQWSYESPIVYFPEYYFQYIFYCFTIYYFGRKSILLGMLNMRMDVAYQDIDPII